MESKRLLQQFSGPEANQLEECVQGLINKAKEGDAKAFQYLSELICGKIPEADIEKEQVESMTPEERLETMKRAVAALEDQIKNGPGST